MGQERSAPGNPVGLGVSAHRDVLALPPQEALPVAASSSQAASGHSGTARPRLQRQTESQWELGQGHGAQRRSVETAP